MLLPQSAPDRPASHAVPKQETQIEIATMAGIFLLGLALCLIYSSASYMPLDASIVFDGGWRVLQGQIPFRDFQTPCGFTPIYLQALLFRLFGVSWTVYCLHAAVFNGLFGLLAARLVRQLGGSLFWAMLAGALSTVVGYTPMGTPFPDQHAFVFSLAALTHLLYGMRLPPGRWRTVVLGAVPVTVAAALLSKQVPSAYLLPWALLLPLAVPAGARRGIVKPLLAGSVLTLLILGVLASVLRVDLQLTYQCVFCLPAQEASRRLARRANLAFLHTAWIILLDVGLLTIPVSIAGGVLTAAWRGYGRGRVLRTDGCPALVAGILAAALTAVCVVYALTTNQTASNNFPYVFLSIGLIAAAVLAHRKVTLADSARNRSAGRWAAAGALAVLAIVDAGRFHLRVNETRCVSRKNRAPFTGEVLDLQGFRSLTWAMPGMPGYAIYHARAEDVAHLCAFLKSQPENFLLVGDETILYAATGKPSPNPALWYHEGLTYPIPPSREFPAFEARLLDSLRRHHVGWIVVDGEHTWMNTYLWDFPHVTQLCRPEAGPVARIGPFAVYRFGQQAVAASKPNLAQAR